VTKARKSNLAARRDIIARIRDKEAADKLMSILAERYKERPGGYTRVVKAGFRYASMAPRDLAWLGLYDKGLKLAQVVASAVLDNGSTTRSWVNRTTLEPRRSPNILWPRTTNSIFLCSRDNQPSEAP
jgi:hypothetical protein